MAAPVFVLGGWQTDFAENWVRAGRELFDGMRDTTLRGLDAAGVEPGDVEVAHIGNFAAELFCGQGHLGGLFAQAHPAFAALPASRHEAACASGSIAILAASADIEAGRYGCAAVLGVELMRNVPGERAAQLIGGPAMWAGHECTDVRFPWPHLFSRLGDVYAERYGLDRAHLARIAEINFGNARRNPNAQTRAWALDARSFAEDDERNPVIDGRIRKHDCGQITDGAALLVLAGGAYAAGHARRHGRRLEDVPRLLGFGHRTGPITFEQKVAASRDAPYVLPHVRATALDAYRRAGIEGPRDLDGFEVHDCFTTTEYLAIDHLGITGPGESWRAIESGEIERGGRLPVNPSGGLIGLGHPVGATGVRMALDAYRQVTGAAGDCQVEGARHFGTLNIGGSGTTAVCLVIGRA